MQEQTFVCLFITCISNPAQKVWYVFPQMVLNFYCNNEVVFIPVIVQGIKIFFNISGFNLRNRMHKIS